MNRNSEIENVHEAIRRLDSMSADDVCAELDASVNIAFTDYEIEECVQEVVRASLDSEARSIHAGAEVRDGESRRKALGMADVPDVARGISLAYGVPQLAGFSCDNGGVLTTQLLECVFLAVKPGLLAFVKNRIPSSMRSQLAAEDVLQDVWVLAGRKIDTFRPEGDNAAERWLIRIARNALIDRIKAKSRTKRSGSGLRLASMAGSSMLDIFATVASAQRSSSKDARSAEVERVLLRAMETLPLNRRQAIWMKYIEEVPTSVIAERMEKTESAVRSLLAQGLTQLRKTIGSSERFFSDFRVL